MEVKDSEQMEREFREAERKIGRLKAAESTLNKLFQDVPQEQPLFESEIESVRNKLKDLSKVDEVERDVEDLGKSFTEYNRAKGEIIGMIAEALKGKGGNKN